MNLPCPTPSWDGKAGEVYNSPIGQGNKNNIIDLEGIQKTIDLIEPGDKLSDNNIVYGTIEIDGRNISQFKHFIDGNVISGSRYLYSSSYNNKKVYLDKTIIKSHDKLYHLLTTKKHFSVNNSLLYDYNYWIDEMVFS